MLKELLDRAENFRLIVVKGSNYTVEGNTYPVRNTLKDYGAKWDSYERTWWGEIKDVKMLWKMAWEIGAIVKVDDIPNYFLSSLSEDVLKIYEEVREVAEKNGKEDPITGDIMLKPDTVREIWEEYMGRDKEMEVGL